MRSTERAASHWYNEFEAALCLKQFDVAKHCFELHTEWKRRVKIDEMLAQICDKKNFDWGHNGNY